MDAIPTELKKLLFGKDDNEGLSAEEQLAWETSLLDVQSSPVIMNMVDLGLQASPGFYNQKEAAWEKFEKYLSRNRPSENI